MIDIGFSYAAKSSLILVAVLVSRLAIIVQRARTASHFAFGPIRSSLSPKKVWFAHRIRGGVKHLQVEKPMMFRPLTNGCAMAVEMERPYLLQQHEREAKRIQISTSIIKSRLSCEVG
jgi:hypothetical protein